MLRFLIADDNHEITRILADYARKQGYQADVAWDGEEALAKFSSARFDIILLDVMMPKKDGFEVCRTIRETSTVPIIMITARGDDFDKIMGLDIGADDYIVKPFSQEEVMARIRAIMRRIEKTSDNAVHWEKLAIDNLTLCLEEYKVMISGNKVSLTKKEMELLWMLAAHSGIVFTRDQLLDSIWGYDYYGDARTVDTHIKRLRAKLDKFEHKNWNIQTVWGRGYKMEVNPDEEKNCL